MQEPAFLRRLSKQREANERINTDTKKFIKLTRMSDMGFSAGEIWVKDDIKFISREGKLTTITMSDGDTILVRDTPKYIISLLNNK